MKRLFSCSSSTGQYLSPHGKCHLCDVTCLQCTGPEREDCTSCSSSWFFDDGQCSIHCQKGRFALGNQCHVCHHTCEECTDEGPDNCTSCDKDKFGVARYLFHGQCRDVCPEGFFHSVRKQCEPCPAACLLCVAANRCLRCSPGHKLKNNQCFPLECSTGEVVDAEQADCLPCDEGCKQCKRKDPENETRETICLKCEDDYYQLGTDCHQACPDRTLSVDNTMICAPCGDKKCVICDKSQCYWCEDGFYVFDGECVEHCGDGFFVDEETRDCEPCHHACHTCGGPRYNDCDSCKDGFTLKGGECLDRTQLVACPEKKFRNIQGECEFCHSSCKTCSASFRDNCTSCNPGHFLTAQQTCMPRCPPGAFANKTSGRCEDCSGGCVMCQGDQQCLRCRSGLYLQHGVCVVECQRGFPEGGLCEPCAPECTSCQRNSSYCLSCETQYLLLDHSCRSHCPEGYYTAERECRHCASHCKTCNQDGLCNNCERYYFLHKGECLDDCPNGYFANERQQECVRCHSDCASCDGPGFDDCNVCRNLKAVRYNGECLSHCPNNTYYDKTTNECRECDRSCLTCSGHEPSSCLTCGTNRRKDASGHCVWFNQCSLQSYMDQNGQCQQCHKTCRRCAGPDKDHCLSCNKPHFLLNNTCVLKCPVGYYAENADERACERCHFSCQSCTGRHSLQCVTCKQGYFRQGMSCVEFCSNGHFGNNTAMACERCDPSCNQCWGRGNRNCLSCQEKFVFVKRWGQCLQRCPPGFYQDSKSTTCLKCHPTCKTCSDEGALFCQSCYDGFMFTSGICNSPCLTGYYPASQGHEHQSDEPICNACDPSCTDCTGPSKWNCTVCPALQILSDDGRCLSCCEKRSDDKPIPWECCDCSVSQDECIMGVNFVMGTLEDLEAQGSVSKMFVTICVLLILLVGGGVFLFLSVRAKSRAIAPKHKTGGYEKLDTGGDSASKPITSSLGEYIDRNVRGEDEEENEDDDIVYMANDGTVYRRFKYGLLDEDEIELEYDDESYSYT